MYSIDHPLYLNHFPLLVYIIYAYYQTLTPNLTQTQYHLTLRIHPKADSTKIYSYHLYLKTPRLQITIISATLCSNLLINKFLYCIQIHSNNSSLLPQIVFFIKKCFLQHLILCIRTDFFASFLIFFRTLQHTTNLLTRKFYTLITFIYMMLLCTFNQLICTLFMRRTSFTFYFFIGYNSTSPSYSTP